MWTEEKKGKCLFCVKTFTAIVVESSVALSLCLCLSLSLSALFPLLELFSISLHLSPIPHLPIQSNSKMVNWKAADATDRLFASLIAGHPNLRVGVPKPYSPPPALTNPPQTRHS